MATVVQKHFTPPLPYQLTLLQAIPKGKTMETIIQKATELGVSRIVPLLSERTVDTHVHNILGKLDLTSRAQIAVWAVEHGLNATR